MATPVWFDANAYVMNKAAQLGMGTDSLRALAAFKDAGWNTDADSLYNHFVQYGNAEGVSPNAWFDVSDYLYSKGQSFYNTTSVSTSQLKSLEATFKAAGWSAWDHYAKGYWAENYATEGFLNPSAEVNIQKYMDDKLAQMKKTDSTYTMDKLVKAFQDSGMDPVTHYYMYGQNEGLTMSGAEGSFPGKTFSLTAGNDEIIGSNGADYIKAGEGTLGSNDYIDGMGGSDTLYANINTSDSWGVISPEIRNVETVLFRAQLDLTNGNGGSSGGNNGNNLTDAYFDAENVTFDDAKALLTIGSDNSRANMTIEDVRWNSNQTTIRFSNTDPGNVDLDVYFDPQHLTSDDVVTTGKLTAELIDTVGALTTEKGGHNNALWDNPYNGFKFTLDGKEYTLNFGAYNNSTDKAPTYDALVKQMQAAIDKDPVLSKLGLTVAKGDVFDARVGIGDHKGDTVSGSQIVISTNQGELQGGNWIASNGLPPTNSTSATFSDDASTTCPLILTNVELDNVGRVDWNADTDCLPNDIINGSNAGDLVVGSMADRGGIERMDITVDRGSWLSSISSTNQTLRMITVKGEDIDGNGKADDGALYIGDWDDNKDTASGGGNNLPITWTDAAQFLNADNAGEDDEAGLNDVAVFDATDYKGDINIGVDITAASYDKYLKDVDGVDGPDGMAPLAGYDSTFTYKTGEGDDVINMTVNGAIAADNDFKMNISTGKGDDLVAFRYDGMTAGQSLNQKNLQNVTIDTGEGNDTVWFYADEAAAGSGGGSAIINTGAGNDVIYANQQENWTGAVKGANDYNAVFAFNTTDTRINVANMTGATLHNDMAVGMNNFTATGVAGETLQVTVKFMGHTVTADLGKFSTTSMNLTAEAINKAIITAITNDDVLGNLLSAKDGAGHTLLIESLINGAVELTDLGITFASKSADGKVFTANAFTGNWYDSQYATDNSATPNANYTGHNSTSSQVIVDGGAGNDLIVLGPNNGLMDIVKVSAGDDTLFGFHTGEDKISLSGVLTAITGGTAGSLVDNAVAILTGKTAADANGIFTQAEVTKLVTDKSIMFSGSTSATGVVVLQENDADGNAVYTLVKVTNGSTPTATILGSYTMSDSQTLAFGDFTISDVLQDSTTGRTYGAAQYLANNAATVTGTLMGDTFGDLNNDSLKYNSGDTTANITKVDGGLGDDTFNINGSVSNLTGGLLGGEGNDTFNISVVGGKDAKIFGGTGIDTVKIKSGVTGAFDMANKLTNVEKVDYASNDLLTVSGDASLNTVNITATKDAHVTLTATDSTELTVNLGDYAGKQDTIKIGDALVEGGLKINNFEVGTGKDIINTTEFAKDIANATLHGTHTIAASINMTTGGTDSNIAVLTDIAALTKDNFTTSTAASSTKIKLDTAENYLFVVNNTDANDGKVYYVVSDGTADTFEVKLLGTLDLMDGQHITGLATGNFSVA